MSTTDSTTPAEFPENHAAIDVLRAAANRLDALDQAATPGPWRMDEKHGRDITDEGWSYFGILADRQGKRPREIACMTVDDPDMEERPRPDALLLVALRPLAAPLAEWLRDAADDIAFVIAEGDAPHHVTNVHGVKLALVVMGASS